MAAPQGRRLFDEWIAMDDRSNGNILFNGETFALIDHESAISSHIQHDCFGIDYYSNQLLQVAIHNIDYSDELSVQKQPMRLILGL